MKNVLITGATGFLGVELIKECLNRGYNPIAIGHSEHRIVKSLERFPNLSIYCLDISNNKEQVKKIINKRINL